MAAAWRPQWRPLLSVAIVVAIAGSVVAKNVAQLSVTEIEDAIQVGIRFTKHARPRLRAAKSYELRKLTVQRDVR